MITTNSSMHDRGAAKEFGCHMDNSSGMMHIRSDELQTLSAVDPSGVAKTKM
jgi:hypothetical protein